MLETLELKLTQEGDGGGGVVASVSEGSALLEDLFSLLSSLDGLAPEDSDYLEVGFRNFTRQNGNLADTIQIYRLSQIAKFRFTIYFFPKFR